MFAHIDHISLQQAAHGDKYIIYYLACVLTSERYKCQSCVNQPVTSSITTNQPPTWPPPDVFTGDSSAAGGKCLTFEILKNLISFKSGVEQRS